MSVFDGHCSMLFDLNVRGEMRQIFEVESRLPWVKQAKDFVDLGAVIFKFKPTYTC